MWIKESLHYVNSLLGAYVYNQQGIIKHESECRFLGNFCPRIGKHELCKQGSDNHLQVGRCGDADLNGLRCEQYHKEVNRISNVSFTKLIIHF